MAGVGSILLQPDVTLARSKSGEKGAVSRSWVRPTHVTMGRELADARFSKGNWWMWQYSDGEGKPYSWERYSVVAVDGDEVPYSSTGRRLVVPARSRLRESTSRPCPGLSLATNLTLPSRCSLTWRRRSAKRSPSRPTTGCTCRWLRCSPRPMTTGNGSSADSATSGTGAGWRPRQTITCRCADACPHACLTPACATHACGCCLRCLHRLRLPMPAHVCIRLQCLRRCDRHALWPARCTLCTHSPHIPVTPQ